MSATETMDPMAFLTELAAEKPKAKGKQKAGASDPAMDAALDKWIEADREVKKWEGVRTTAESQVLAFGKRARIENCRALGKVESSVRINGKLTMTQRNQYCAVPAEHLPKLREAFGADADRYFVPRLKISLTEAASGDKALLATLIAALGQERFKAAFSVTQTVEVTESFHNDLTLNPAVEQKAQGFMDMEVIRAYKPSLRV